MFITADGYIFHSIDDGKTRKEIRTPMARTGAVWGRGAGDVFVLGAGEAFHSRAQ